MRRMKRSLVLVCAVGLAFSAASSQAGEMDGGDSSPGRLVIFGDSLSDTGNVSAATQPLVDAGVIPHAIPGPAYYQGRFSNGPVWVDRLADGLGLDRPRPSLEEGRNYAFGGGQTEDRPTSATPVIPDPSIAGSNGFIDMSEQVERYAASGSTPRPDDLFVLWGGANDFLLGGQQNPAAPALNIARQVRSLHAEGARDFLVSNLPPLGAVPSVRDQTISTPFGFDLPLSPVLNAQSDLFNLTLDLALDHLERRLDGIHITRLDTDSLLTSIVNDPLGDAGRFDFVNVSDPVAEGLTMNGEPTFQPPTLVGDPEKYLFWDDTHLTAAGQRLLGDLALDTLANPSLGNRFGRPELPRGLLRALDAVSFGPLGAGFGPGTLPLASVPEPAGAFVLAVGGGLMILRRRRRV